MTTKALGSTEVLATVEELVAVKGLSREALIGAIEDSIVDIVSSKYSGSGAFVAKMNRKTGEIEVFREMNVVQKVENDLFEVALAVAKKSNSEAQVGDKIYEPLPDIYRNRAISKSIASLLTQNIQTLEKAMEYAEYSKRKGEIVSGVIKKSTPIYVIVGIGNKTEAILPKKHMINGEKLIEGNRINAYIQDVERSDSNFQIVLSRSSNEFLIALMKEGVPEIEDKMIEIKHVARDPGSRAKVVVWSPDYNVDPVGACIGPRGSRIQPIVKELKGEKIDIILWHRDFDVFIKNVLVPGKVSKINIEQVGDVCHMEVVTPNDGLSTMIGRGGQNVRLASTILNAQITIVSEEEKQQKMMQKFQYATAVIMEALSVDETIAQLLFAEGFTSVNLISDANLGTLSSIDGFDATIATEIQERATNYIASQKSNLAEMLKQHQFNPDIVNIPGMTLDVLLSLPNKGIRSVENLADLAADEFIELVSDIKEFKISEANNVIMAARKIAYNI